jgi:DHA1 family purine base/nucleoside efflux pump-like MFS transporter
MTAVERSYAVPRIGAPVLARLWVLAIAMFAVGTNAFVIAGVLPELAAAFAVPVPVVATAISWYAGVVAVASPLFATFLARMPRRALLTGGMAVIAIGTAMTALAPDVTTFILGRVVAAIGGAALVPPATAAAPSLVDPRHRGRAIAIVTFGFSAAVALGSPLGTAIAAALGWRAALGGVAALAVLLTAVIGLMMTGIPGAAGASLRARFAVLADPRILCTLLGMVAFTLSFNVVYVFSAEVLAPALGGAAGLLAVVLLAYGLATLLGTWLGGRVVDRFGGVRATVVALAASAAVYALIDASTASLVGAIVLYAVWGLSSPAGQVGIQDLLVVANPREAGVTLSWYSTAMYVGVALAPIVGGSAFGIGAWTIPALAAVAALLGLGLVLAGRLRPVAAIA